MSRQNSLLKTGTQWTGDHPIASPLPTQDSRTTAYWEGSPSKCSLWAQRCRHCWKHLWNSRYGTAFSIFTIFFGCLQYLEIFVLLRQTLFLETEVIRSQTAGKGWMFLFSNRIFGQKLLDTERLVGWSIVMVKNPMDGLKFRPFPTHSFP
jgi:hypothetical protein